MHSAKKNESWISKGDCEFQILQVNKKWTATSTSFQITAVSVRQKYHRNKTSTWNWMKPNNWTNQIKVNWPWDSKRYEPMKKSIKVISTNCICLNSPLHNASIKKQISHDGYSYINAYLTIIWQIPEGKKHNNAMTNWKPWESAGHF